jgi:diguanylate cyclase (GGDEF)-like protein
MQRAYLGGWLAAACLALAASACASAADAVSVQVETTRLTIESSPPGHLPWVVFDERSGLPQHVVVDMLADQRGFVWAATQDGLARYNGHAWETVALPRSMHSNYPRAIRAAKDGGLWVGTFDGGLAYLRDGKWKAWSTKDGLPSNLIRGLLETIDVNGDSVLWIATDNGLAELKDGKIVRTFSAKDGLPSLDTEALYQSRIERGLIVGTSNGLARLVGDRFEPVAVPQQLIGSRIDDIVESPGLHGDNALWIASYGAGMGLLENGKWTILDKDSGLPSNVEVLTKSRALDGSPALWIGTEGGLLRFEHGRFTQYDERSGLPIRIIWKVLETTSPGGVKTLWLGTWGGGIVRLSPNFWTAFDASVGMPSGAVTSVLLSKDEHGAEQIWAGTSDGNLARFSGTRFESVELPPVLRSAIIFSLLETTAADGSRALWVASYGGGIGRLEHDHWTVLEPRGLTNRRIYQLLETKADDGSSVIWAGTDGAGLAHFEHGSWSNYTTADGLPSDIVTQVMQTTAADGTRTIWVGTHRGIGRFDGHSWHAIGKADGLLSENISSLQATTDPDGTRWLWAGTFYGGASRLRLDDSRARWESWSTDTSPALPSDTVQSVAEDHTGNMYMCTMRGIARFAPRTPTPENPDRFSEAVFTTEDGLPSSDCQQGAHFVDEEGRIWMGTAKGLAMFDPRNAQADNAPKPLVIDSARLTDRPRSLRGGEVLSHRECNLTISGALLAYGDESRIRYRYQLVGFDAQPSAWNTSSLKEYTNLGAGDYTYKLWGKDPQGIQSGPVELRFSVRPAPWLTLWAFIGYALLIVLAAYTVMQVRLRIRLHAMAARTRELESVVADRTQDLVAARDELQRLATEDALTGIANRRKFETTLEKEWKRAQRDGHWLSLVLLDIDFFKRYNDHYGHAAGDQCLRAVAQAVAAQCTRPADLVARYGGEEFVMVLPEIAPEGVHALLRAVLRAVDALALEHADSSCAPHVTISLGAVSLQPSRQDEAKDALKRADELLYQVKDDGRHHALHVDGKAVRSIRS